jgi:hypothetical protein
MIIAYVASAAIALLLSSEDIRTSPNVCGFLNVLRDMNMYLKMRSAKMAVKAKENNEGISYP